MDQEKKVLTIDLDVWGDDVEEILLPACPVMAEVRAQVSSGRAILYSIRTDGERIANFVLRVDCMASGKHQGVIVAAAGRGGELNLTDELLPFIEKMFVDCDSIRVHTRRPGLVRQLVGKYGYGLEEIVLMKNLKE